MALNKTLLALALGLSLTACAGLITKHQKIGAACATSTSALEAVTAAKVAGKASKAQLDQAIAIYTTTVPFCEPVADNLSSADYSSLIRAVAALTAKKAEVTP